MKKDCEVHSRRVRSYAADSRAKCLLKTVDLSWSQRPRRDIQLTTFAAVVPIDRRPHEVMVKNVTER